MSSKLSFLILFLYQAYLFNKMDHVLNLNHISVDHKVVALCMPHLNIFLQTWNFMFCKLRLRMILYMKAHLAVNDLRLSVYMHFNILLS